jgi:hypothetical protein
MEISEVSSLEQNFEICVKILFLNNSGKTLPCFISFVAFSDEGSLIDYRRISLQKFKGSEKSFTLFNVEGGTKLKCHLFCENIVGKGIRKI